MSNYPIFRQHILPNLEVELKNLNIRAVYGGQVGHLVLSSTKYLDERKNNELPLDKVLESIHKNAEAVSDSFGIELSFAFINCPHIFNLPKDNFPTISIHNSINFRHSFTFDRLISFNIKVPDKNRKFNTQGNGIEEFHVLMEGSNYVSFAKLNDCPTLLSIGQEFREQLRAQFVLQGKEYRLGQIGPAPMHPKIFVIDIANEEHVTCDTYCFEEHIYILVNLQLDNRSVEGLFEDVLRESEFDLSEFYMLSKLRGQLLELHNAIYQKLQESLNSYTKLGTNLFFIKFKELAGLRTDLLQIHKGVVEFELQLAYYENSRKECVTRLEKNTYLAELKEYFSKISEPHMPIGNALFKTLEYIEKSISSSDVGIRTIFAAVLGASIGVFVALLLKM